MTRRAAAAVLCGILCACPPLPAAADQLETGRQLFEKIWTPAEGLGPLFNTRSCVSCHLNGGRGAPPARSGQTSDSMTVKTGVLPASEAEAQKLLTRWVSVLLKSKA